ncbi:MAG TPA: hypothetical protein VET23_09530 [Chitinophagaceae bacterium]|nr:hypothetical protein [Chitinophagaceae bacterium]
MPQKHNILQELNDLGSTLGNIAPQNIYLVPDGYFEELANQVLNRVKNLHKENAQDELVYLSPLLSSLSIKNPYSVPEGYFESLEERLSTVHENKNYQSPQEELAAISPLLSRLNKQGPYNLPQGYFETLEEMLGSRLDKKPERKVVSIVNRSWFRYAAAAVLVGAVAVGGFLFEGKKSSIDPNKNPDEWVAKNVKKVSTDKLDDFIKLADEESSAKEVSAAKDEKSDDIKDLMKDVPENQIQEFLNETSAIGSGDNASMN